MKLAKIEHRRCDEYRASTYFWVPDDFTELDLGDLAQAAQMSYFAAEDAWKNSPKAPFKPNWHPDYDKFLNKTVAEVKAEHQILLDAYSEWTKLHEYNKKDFQWHLEQVGKGKVKRFYSPDDAPVLTAEISWGHRHGETIEYSGTQINHDFSNALQDVVVEGPDEPDI